MAQIKFTHREDKEQVIKGTPKVPFSKSKKLVSMDGSQVLYYVDTEIAFRLNIFEREFDGLTVNLLEELCND